MDHYTLLDWNSIANPILTNKSTVLDDCYSILQFKLEGYKQYFGTYKHAIGIENSLPYQ